MFLSVLGGLFACALAYTLYAGSDASNLSKEFPWQFRLAARLRTPILVFVVVPLSFLRWAYNKLVLFLRHRGRGFAQSSASHGERVQVVVDQIKQWNADGRKRRLRTARPNWASMSLRLASNKTESHCIATHHLDHILDVNPETLTMRVEPAVIMGSITSMLLPMGLALEVQVEMESITIGGVALGFGLETNSHRSGFFQETVLEYEMVLASGEVKKVNEQSDPDLFRAIPWSYGCLGFLTCLTVRLVRVKPYVRIRYVPTYSAQDLQDKMLQFALQANPPTFLEATGYSRDTAVIQVSEYCDAPKTAAEKAIYNPINYWFKPFYYKWVETFLTKGEKEEIVPLSHYYHRFTRSIFWELEDMIPFSNHPIYRTLWGWLGAPEVSLLKLFQGPVIRKASVDAHVVQESIMPLRELRVGLENFHEWFNVYPLLIFPMRVYDRGNQSGFLHPRKDRLEKGKNWGLWVDVGAYGTPKVVKEGGKFNPKRAARAMEHWTREMGGWQACYTDIFCTRDEFRTMFDHTLFESCRARLGATDAFPEPYEKVKPEAGLVDLSEEEAKEAAAKRK